MMMIITFLCFVCLVAAQELEQQPTDAPTSSLTKPSSTPTSSPIRKTSSPSISPTTPPPTTSPTQDRLVRDFLDSKRELIDQRVLVSYDRSSGQSYSSTQYTINALMKSIHLMAIDGFGADFKFDLWEGDGTRYIHGLVNLAAFLANCMVEAIEDDVCDELNWQETSGRYAISNSCGQEGRSYEDENCSLGTLEFLSCDVDTNMQVTAVSKGTKFNAPPPFTCQRGSGEGNFAGYWDASSGREVTNTEFPNAAGRTDTEGCCWWGRGALSTRGVCSIGKMNYYLGKKGADLGRFVLYPTVDFCRLPESTCASVYSEELRWNSAFFEWAERVQRYEANGWNFGDQLAQFEASRFTDDSFINGASRILSRGCHTSDCSKYGDARMLNKRRTYFFMIVNDVFDLKSLTRRPTRTPTKPPILSTVSIPDVAMPILQQNPTPMISSGVQPGTNDEDLASQLRPSLSGNSPSQPIGQPSNDIVMTSANEETNMPTYFATLIVIEDNAATSRVSATWFGLLVAMWFCIHNIHHFMI